MKYFLAVSYQNLKISFYSSSLTSRDRYKAQLSQVGTHWGYSIDSSGEK